MLSYPNFLAPVYFEVVSHSVAGKGKIDVKSNFVEKNIIMAKKK